MVCFEVENRGVPQNSQVRLQSRGSKAADSSTPHQSAPRFLHLEVACLLDDHARRSASDAWSDLALEGESMPIPGEAARRSGMMPPTDSEMISPTDSEMISPTVPR
jgi:hypothetical protein